MTAVLVVEDDAAIRQALIRGLRESGFVVSAVDRGFAAVEHCVSAKPDAVLLDLGLPDVDGLSVLGMVRAVSAVPIIVVTARDDERSVVAALDGGADDYVVKPFSLHQVAARLRAVMRRSATEDTAAALQIGGLTIHPAQRWATLDGVPLDLARKEFDLLLLLAERQDLVVTKREILAEVWQQPYGGNERTVDVHVSWLRRKLGETAAQPRYLHTVRGVGLRLVDPATGGRPDDSSPTGEDA